MRDVTRTHGNIFDDVPKLGPALMSSIPSSEHAHGPPLELDVVDDQNLNSKYVLSGDQRRLIKTRQESDRSDRNEKILRKRDRLPERIQHLIDDVALLADSAYTSAGRWEKGLVERKERRSKWAEWHQQIRHIEESDDEIDFEERDFEAADVEYYQSPFDSPAEFWDALIDVKQRNQQVRDDVFFHGSSVASKEVEFGYEIGSLLRMLRPDNGEDPPGMDLIWGFVLAFIAGSKSEIEHEEATLAEVIQEMNDRHDSRRDDAEQIPEPGEVAQLGDDYDERTAAAVKEMGFKPHPILVREVRYHQPVLDDETNHKNAAKKVVSNIADAVPLQVTDELYSRLVEDLEAVENRSVPGIDSARTVIEQLQRPEASEDKDSEESESDESEDEVDAGNKDSEDTDNDSEEHTSKSPSSWVVSRKSGEIASDLNIDTSVISAVMNRLSDDPDTELWTTSPIVVGNDGEGAAVHWELTHYGTLLAHILLRKNKDTRLLYWFALGPEELSLYERQMIIEAITAEGLMLDG